MQIMNVAVSPGHIKIGIEHFDAVAWDKVGKKDKNENSPVSFTLNWLKVYGRKHS